MLKILITICCLLILSNLKVVPTPNPIAFTIGNTSELKPRPTLLQFIVAVIIAFLWKPFLQKNFESLMLVLLGLFQKCYFWIENTVLLQWQKMVLNKELFSREIAYALWLHLNLRIFFSAICYQIYEVRMHLPAFLLDFLQFMPAGTWVASKCYLSKSEIDFHQNNAWQLEIWPKSASRKKVWN